MDIKLYLLEKIEACRREMLELSQKKELTSDAVVSASTRLDYWLNEYDKA
ncbi:Spo0E family sporulation regulatory protein-aspartic acid phosphatase [Sediminibacillus dalangtanensis]|uniref:Spo0E family sporulation regulatory protein-aspartic acid phosphatase n=1 Tax=Sediminibacillus dalangtanensis TaxID=2729421 RepID=A0ABX7VPQ1_9BACI|nr:aspartyl-phosphate phosphatase Spo0E family protein [Sediminibacillus dalangtanensis]QTM97929.1 Spo0E family sporulation regulatory protein-aspartic acid phosphatase [Sediminibacillus dalangtanensis]